MVRTALILFAALILFPLTPVRAAPSFPADPVPERIVVEKDDGTRTTVACVERWPGDFVRLVSGKGDVRFLSIQTIRTIRDEAGIDVTERVLRDWEGFGTMPRAPELVDEPSPKLIPPRFKQEFGVIQVGVLGRMNATDGESNAAVALDLGTMRNLSSNQALGGTLGLVADEEYLRIAVKPRLRHWMSSSLAFDVAPGIFHSVDSDGSPTSHGPVGFLLETSLLWSGFTVTGQLEVVETERVHYEYLDPLHYSGSVTESSTEASYHLGMKLGGGAAVPATFIAMFAIVVIGWDASGEIY